VLEQKQIWQYLNSELAISALLTLTEDINGAQKLDAELTLRAVKI